jgi:cell division protein FtsN
MRLKKRSRAPIVDTGYRSPALARGLRMDGKVEVMVFRVEDLTKVEKETQVIRISGTVGARKRKDILDKAKALDIMVLNQRPVERKQAEPQAEEVEKPAVAEEEAEEETEEEEVMAEEEKKEEPKPKPKKTKSPKKEKPAAPAKEEEPMEAAEEEDEEE